MPLYMQEFEMKFGERTFTEAELTAMAVAEAPAGADVAPVPASIQDEAPAYKNRAYGYTVLDVGLVTLPPVRSRHRSPPVHPVPQCSQLNSRAVQPCMRSMRPPWYLTAASRLPRLNKPVRVCHVNMCSLVAAPLW